MSDSEEYYPAQFVVHCDFCDTNFDVTWVCHTCDFSICQKCKDIHLRKEKFRHHKVLKRGETEPNLPLQGLKCDKHSPKEYSAFCKNCEKAVCMNCVIQDHEGHKLTDLREAIDIYKEKLGKYRDALEQTCLSEINQGISRLQSDRSTVKNEGDDIIRNIDKEETAVISIVQEVYGKLREDVREMQKEREAEIERAMGSLESSKGSVESLVKRCNVKLKSRNVNVIKFTSECPSIADLNPTKLPTLFPVTSLNYVSGQIDKILVKEKMGKIITTSKTEEKILEQSTESTKSVSLSDSIVTTFQCYLPGRDNQVSEIVTVDPAQAWLSNVYSSELRLYNDKGTHFKTLQAGFEVYSFAVDTAGDFITSDYDHKCIKKITSQGKVTTLIDSLPSTPYGLCLNHNQEIVVCFPGENTLSIHSPDGRKLRSRVKSKGVLVRPCRVTQNGNLDYCVVDDWSKVVVVDVHGSYRWTYTGQLGLVEFNPDIVSCDQSLNVVVSDDKNHKVHVVDKDGQFMQILLTEKHGIESPRGICVGKDGRLWLGQENCKVHIIKYKAQ